MVDYRDSTFMMAFSGLGPVYVYQQLVTQGTAFWLRPILLLTPSTPVPIKCTKISNCITGGVV